jgi:hypothetical protein
MHSAKMKPLVSGLWVFDAGRLKVFRVLVVDFGDRRQSSFRNQKRFCPIVRIDPRISLSRESAHLGLEVGAKYWQNRDGGFCQIESRMIGAFQGTNEFGDV